jgi:TupA-like ATPgrasp
MPDGTQPPWSASLDGEDGEPELYAAAGARQFRMPLEGGLNQTRWRDQSRLVRLWRLAGTMRPRTFNEKVRYKRLRDRRPLIATFADKAAVREYVAATVGAEHLPRAYGVLNDAAQLVDLELPEEYVVKPTHGSGAVVVVSAQASPTGRLPEPGRAWRYTRVRPDSYESEDLARVAAEWLGHDFGGGPNQEWAYSQIPRRLLVEEMLSGPDGGLPDDYKFFVFHGRCRYVQVVTDRFSKRPSEDFYLPSWERLGLSSGKRSADARLCRPDRLCDMIELAERLGAETDFVRVDLYTLPNRLVFGELTNYPAGGYARFDPPHFDLEFGRHWTVPRRYR